MPRTTVDEDDGEYWWFGGLADGSQIQPGSYVCVARRAFSASDLPLPCGRIDIDADFCLLMYTVCDLRLCFLLLIRLSLTAGPRLIMRFLS